MHIEAWDFCSRASKITGPVTSALEVGARNVNGSARDCWSGAHWTGTDISPGPNVDVVGDWLAPQPTVKHKFGLVLSTEMLEHCTHPRLAVQRMVEASTEWVVVTCATHGRAPHSGVDGGQVRGDEWYANVELDVLEHPRLETVLSEVHAARGDLYYLGRVRG